MQTWTVYQTRLFRDTNPSPASHKWTDSFFFFLKWCRARSTAAGDRIKVSAWLTRKESRKKASQTHFILCFYISHLRVPTEYSEQQSLFEPASTCRAVKPVMRGNKTENHSSKLSQHSTMLIVGQNGVVVFHFFKILLSSGSQTKRTLGFVSRPHLQETSLNCSIHTGLNDGFHGETRENLMLGHKNQFLLAFDSEKWKRNVELFIWAPLLLYLSAHRKSNSQPGNESLLWFLIVLSRHCRWCTWVFWLQMWIFQLI